MALTLPRLTDASVPYVQDGARSEHWELVKLVEGEIDGIFSVTGRPGFFVKTTNRFWQFDEEGRVLGMSFSTDVGPHGVGFDLIHPDSPAVAWKAFRRDWLMTGNDKPAAIPIETAPKDDVAALLARLDSAEEIQEVSGYSPDHNGFRGFAVKEGKDWKVLDVMAWDDSARYRISVTRKEVKDREQELWTAHELDHGKRQRQCLLKQGNSPIRDENSRELVATNFSIRSIEFDEGFGAWVFWKTVGWWLAALFAPNLHGSVPYAYWGGAGTFALKHQGETLRFRATASSGEDHTDGVVAYAPNLDLLEMSGGLRVLRVVTPGKEHNLHYEKGLGSTAHDEVGLYLVRRRAPDVSELKGQWLPEVKGLTWGTWQFPSGQVDFSAGPSRAFAQVPESESESRDDLPRGGRVLPQSFGQIPSKLRLRLPLCFGEYPASVAVDLGGKEWLFLSHEHEPPELQADIDRAEFAKAWESLGGGEMRLVAEFTERKEKLLEDRDKPDRWVVPSLKLVKGWKSAALANTRWSDPEAQWPRSDEDRKRFLRSRSYQAGGLAQAGRLSAAGWIGVTRDLLRDSGLAKQYGSWLIQEANELLNASTLAKDPAAGRAVVRFWTEALFPILRNDADEEFVKGSSVLTSNSLGNAIEWRDTAMCERILEVLVDARQDSIEHHTLHYNLACYHAWRKDVPGMLASVRRARARGKPAEQFRADPDFAPWLQDPDFQKALDGNGAVSP
ncbi:MAG: hypothetical protein RL318_226 [Fibrobacterota bacterium]|jgi:hypothetical protein